MKVELFNDCLYSSVHTVINECWNIETELIGSDAWGFEYNKPKDIAEGECVWDYVHAFENDSWKTIEILYGIKIKWHYPKNNKELFFIIQESLEKNMPVLVYIDSKSCPWHPNNKSNPHFCLIYEMDIIERVFFCRDVVLNVFRAPITFDQFFLNCGPCITFSDSDNCPRSTDCTWRDVFKNSILRLKNEDSFNKMKILSKDLEREIHQTKYSDIEWITNPITVVRNIGLLQKGRVYFATSLRVLATQYEIINIQEIIDALFNVANMWNSIPYMVFKSKIVQEPIKVIEKIPRKILDISQLEEEISNKLEVNVLKNNLR